MKKQIPLLQLKKINDLVISYNQAVDTYNDTLLEYSYAKNKKDKKELRDAADWVYRAAVVYRKMLLECAINGIEPITRGI